MTGITVSPYRFCMSSLMISMAPSRAFSGVRISCDMLATD